MSGPWLSLLAWLLVVAVVRLFWLVDVPPAWNGLEETVIDGLLKVALWVVAPVLFLIVVSGQSIRRAWKELGLGSNAATGYAFGLLATIPMAAVLSLAPRVPVDAQALAGTVLFGPLAEEVLFRGFLLAFLVRRAGWPLPAALLVTSLAFGLAHVPQENLLMAIRYGEMDAFGSFAAQAALVGAGGVLFGWIYYRTGNLWQSIGLHASINLWWELTNGRAASAIANSETLPISAAHVASFGLAVGLTIWSQRRRAHAVTELVNE